MPLAHAPPRRVVHHPAGVCEGEERARAEEGGESWCQSVRQAGEPAWGLGEVGGDGPGAACQQQGAAGAGDVQVALGRGMWFTGCSS